MAAVFQPNVFQNNVFQTADRQVTDTFVLQLPINCVLAGQQPYEFSYRESMIPRGVRQTQRSDTNRSSVRLLEGGKPGFTVTTNNRGYD